MSDERKEAEEKMAKAIFLSADCWLDVFNFLPPYQLGLGIALISHQFDQFVNEHFKARKWALKFIQIRRKIAKNGTKTKKMEIVNFRGNADDCQIRKCNCHVKSPDSNNGLRKSAPSLLNDCASLRFVSSYFDDLSTEFPPDDSAMASDGQAVAKWLFTPRPDNVPKVFKCTCVCEDYGIFASKSAAIKATFANASSPVNFIVFIWFARLRSVDSIALFDQTNELTREQLAFKRIKHTRHFLLIRCPIARDESKWAEWEKEAIDWEFLDQWNAIEIRIYNDDDIGDGLLDETPGPSDQQK
ncbi:hypothetical protein niasHT_024753 [Heterodera trifolii]|uniref:Uncharacterized protein n=1 Tax=Heterodera trifolii TaxID=157864 RepID=A0ABD2KQ79_9BILA